MKLDLKDSWSVRIDVEVRYQGTGRPYRKHENIIVYAPTIERALAVVRADYPDSTIWAINHANANAIILSEETPRISLSEGDSHV